MTVVYRDASVEVPRVIVDTGSASTILNADLMETLGIVPEPSDRLGTLRGVGGREVVFARHVDRLLVGDTGMSDFEIEIGGMDYGFGLDGILGMDFVRGTGAIVNLRALNLEHAA